MPLRLIEDPAPDPEDVVSLELAKGHLDVDHSDDDVLIASHIRTAFEHLNGSEGILARALSPQAWALDLDAFPAAGDAVMLTLAPVISIDAVKYVDADGATQTVAEAIYIAHLGDPGLVELAPDASWPSTRRQRRAVTIEFTAGYAVTPDRLVSAMLIMIADLYAFRETGVIGTVAGEIKTSATYDRLVNSFIFKPA